MRSICLPFALVIVSASIFVAADVRSADRERTLSKVSKDLLEKRVEAARNVFQLNLERFKNREGIADEGVLSWFERLLAAELEITDNPADRNQVLKVHLERAKEVAKIAVARELAGQGRKSDAEAAKYFLIDAEMQLRETTVE